MHLTQHFLLSEFIDSPTATSLGIDNTPNAGVIANLQALANAVCEPARQGLRFPIRVTSGYRCPNLNTAVGGSSTSQHVKGEAVDLVCEDNRKLFDYIRQYLPFDQLIYEFGDDNAPAWVHVSYSRRYNRRQVLRAVRRNGKARYGSYL